MLSPIPYDPLDCSPPGSSVCGIFLARILESVAISSSRGSSQPRNQTHFSSITSRFFFFFFFFTTEPLGKPQCQMLRTVPGICYMCYLCDLDETVIIVVTLVEVVSSVKINLHYPTICHIKLN